jgi:hypothetical protein
LESRLQDFCVNSAPWVSNCGASAATVENQWFRAPVMRECDCDLRSASETRSLREHYSAIGEHLIAARALHAVARATPAATSIVIRRPV